MDCCTLKGESELYKFKCYRNIKFHETLLNFLANFLMFSTPGRIINEYILTITNENIYLETIGYSTFGNLPEVINTFKIPISQIKDFCIDRIDDENVIKISYKSTNLELIEQNNSSAVFDARSFILNKLKNLK